MKRRLICVLTLVLVLAGCSTKLTYNNLDWLIYWYVDDYVELTKPQKKQMDAKLGEWLAWHRTSELKEYLSHLKLLKQDIETDSMDSQRWLYHFEYGRSHWLRLRDEVVPELAQLATQLDDEQVVYLFAAIEKDNKELEEDRFEGSEEERLEERQERFERQLKSWVGRPSKQQKAIIGQYISRFIPNYALWLEYRKQVQGEARMLFSNRHNDPEFSDKLAALLMNPEQLESDIYASNKRINGELYSNMLAELMPTLSAKQKRKMLAEVEDYIEDISDLMETD